MLFLLKIVQKLISSAYKLIPSKKENQVFHEYILELALKKMNIGGGEAPENSGELNVLRQIKNKINPSNNIVLFDVGANVGNYTKLLHAEFGNLNSTIFSFEPSLHTFNDLKNNLRELPNVSLNNFALGDENKTETLYSDQPASGLASVYKRELSHYHINVNLEETISITTLDDFCKKNKIQNIFFLKLDTEGHEFKILQGARRMLSNKSINYIQFEFGGCNIDSHTYFQNFFTLLNNNYKIYRILQNELYEIKKYSQYHELFHTTNFLCELK